MAKKRKKVRRKELGRSLPGVVVFRQSARQSIHGSDAAWIRDEERRQRAHLRNL